MKQLLRILIIIQLCIASAKAQDILVSGTAIDKKTGHPIPYAHLTLLGSALGGVVNGEGKFLFQIDSTRLTDTLKISSVGYYSLLIPVQEALKTDAFLLEESETELNPVIITPFSAREIIEKVIERIDTNYYTTHSKLMGYYLQANKECEVFRKISENIVQASPAFANSKDLHLSVVRTINNKDFRNFKIEPTDYFSNGFSFDHIQYRRGFFNEDNLDSWRFTMAGGVNFDGDDILIIQADFIANPEIVEHAATIYVNMEDFGVIKIIHDYNWYDPHYIKTEIDSLYEASHRWSGEFDYEKSNGKYLLKYFSFQHLTKLYKSFRKELVCSIELYSEFTTRQVIRQSLASQAEKNIDLENFEQAKTKLYKNVIHDLDSLRVIEKNVLN